MAIESRGLCCEEDPLHMDVDDCSQDLLASNDDRRPTVQQQRRRTVKQVALLSSLLGAAAACAALLSRSSSSSSPVLATSSLSSGVVQREEELRELAVRPQVTMDELKKIAEVFSLEARVDVCQTPYITCLPDGTLAIGRKTNPKEGITDPSHCGFKQVSLSAFDGVTMASVSGLNFDFLFDSEDLCQPAGNLSSLKWFPNVRSLRLGRQVVGAVKDLLPLTQLEDLSLQGTYFAGTLDDLQPMTSLKNLTISYTSIHGGDLKVLRYMTSLEKLSLDYFPVKSSLSALQGLTNLKYLRMKMCGEPGTIADFDALTSLEELELQEIGGPLSGLRNMKNLRSLKIGARVHGYLHDLKQLTQLESVELETGQVIGNLTHFSNMTKLRYLSLKHFNELEGSLEDFQDMHNLKYLELPSATMTGDISVLRQIQDLERLAAARVDFKPRNSKNNLAKQMGRTEDEPAVDSQPFVPAHEEAKLRQIFQIPQGVQLCQSAWITCKQSGLWIGHKSSSGATMTSNIAGLSQTDTEDCSMIQVNFDDFMGTEMTTVAGLVFDDVYMCQPSGSLSSLKWFPGLKTLRLNRGNQVVGEIKDLQLATQLEHLSFKGSPASGSVDDLASLLKLKSLTLSFSNIEGKLSSLGMLTQLTELEITNMENMGPGITGDLLDLQNMVSLRRLELSEIGGNLYGLRNMKNLEYIDVQAEVVGFLADLMPLSRLRWLNFASGQVIGSLRDFEALYNLEHLNLGKFNPLDGNLRHLAGMTNLQEYRVPTTKLLGYYDDFKLLAALTEFHADHVDLW